METLILGEHLGFSGVNVPFFHFMCGGGAGDVGCCCFVVLC